MKLINILALSALFVTGCNQSVEIEVPFAEELKPQSKVLPTNIGIETLGGVFTTLLHNGCALPCDVTQVFSTAEDNQDQITITLLAGDAQLASELRKLGKYQIGGIAPAARGAPNIAVTFRVSQSGMHLLATDKNGQSTLTWRRLE